MERKLITNQSERDALCQELREWDWDFDGWFPDYPFVVFYCKTNGYPCVEHDTLTVEEARNLFLP